jgi:hypothetical protein
MNAALKWTLYVAGGLAAYWVIVVVLGLVLILFAHPGAQVHIGN